MHIIVVMPTGF